ncbi:MAG TPA: cytochrome c [Gaiellaceae bacterium]|nr:cytochrome c [Gaiellaceae bacterium]
MRRFASFAVLVLLLVGCSDTVPGGKKIVTPTPDTVIGPIPRPTAVNAAAGKAIFLSSGCTACHFFTPAGPKAVGKIGPNLDNLAAYAQKAKQDTLTQFISAAITSPPAPYVPSGYSNVMPATYGSSLTPAQLADLVAFLAKGP